MIKYLFVTLLISPFLAFSQGNRDLDSTNISNQGNIANRVLNVSIFNHAISLPFYKMIRLPIHPGLQIGKEFHIKESAKAKLFQTLNVGFIYNAYNGTGLYLSSQFSLRHKIKYGVFAEGGIGGGYLRVFHPTNIYKLSANGDYIKANDKGFSSLLISFGISLGYELKSKKNRVLSPFLRYENFIQTRYNSEVPVLPHATFHLGLKIRKNKLL